jgi:L-asparaginase II
VHAAACTADGALLGAWGEAERVAYPRSSLKPLQAFALVASGAAEACGLTDRELAVVCGSHGAEPFHLQAGTILRNRRKSHEPLMIAQVVQPVVQRALHLLCR